MRAVSTMDKFGVFTLRLLPDLLAIYMLANLDDMGFVLLVAPTWLIRKTFGLKSSSNLAKPSSAKQRDTVATDRDDSDATAPNAMALSHFERPNSIVAIRRMVDEVAMYWLYMLSILVVIMAMVYALLRQLNYLSSPSSFAELSARSTPIVRRLSWLPQVVVSYKTKSGSPVPVTYALYSLAYAMLSTIIYYLSGCDKFGVVTVYSLPTYLVHIVMIWQWIVYRKLKQE
ncbi:hypothetical protein GGF42_002501 [Coemansia sp. RSA 2424]|nr:hypothetical protein GGF42_002501 [Coemansia sp. RSA 2424]